MSIFTLQTLAVFYTACHHHRNYIMHSYDSETTPILYHSSPQRKPISTQKRISLPQHANIAKHKKV
jgi:hypothetical protein